MYTLAAWVSRRRSCAAPRRALIAVLAVLLSLTAALLPGLALADNFAAAFYDRAKDALVVTMTYRGTNPNHTFSLQWGACKDTHGDSQHAIEAQVLDSQWQDAARRDYTQTAHFSLAGVSCRPAVVTLRSAPRFYYTVHIPAATGTRH